jgi:NAD(P)-dependent dehydrogenase (short-subunit alcohol dehydrogenase family)
VPELRKAVAGAKGKRLGRPRVSSPAKIREQAAEFTILQFGGIDILINTAAIFPVSPNSGELNEAQWSKTFLVNVTGNYLLARQTEWIFADQALPASMVLSSSANALIPKNGSEAYDVSKSALNHLIRELAIKLSPHVRVNGIVIVETLPARRQAQEAHAPMLANYVFCALAGTTWYFQFFFYTMGETQMGRYKFSGLCTWPASLSSAVSGESA